MIDPIALRHDLHRTPELGFEEQATKARLASILEGLGLEVEIGVGVVAVLRKGKGNRSIAIRAELDALPIHENSDTSYTSQTPGKMHACGHDGHMAMLVGAAQRLANEGKFDGTVVFILQPAEEHGQGALAMIREGLFDRHPVEEIYAIHCLPGLPIGHVQTRTGLICASESLFEIEIHGQGGHAAMPHTGRDALTVAASLIGDLQTLVPRQLPPTSGAVLSVTECVTDGQRNVLPGQVTLRGDLRAQTPDDRGKISVAMQQMVDGIAAAYGVTATFQFQTEFIETINAAGPVEAIENAARTAGLVCDANATPMSFSEDFAHLAQHALGGFLLLGNGENSAPLHAPNFDFNDAALALGVTFWTELVQQQLPLNG